MPIPLGQVTTPYSIVYDGIKPMCFDFDRWGRKAGRVLHLQNICIIKILILPLDTSNLANKSTSNLIGFQWVAASSSCQIYHFFPNEDDPGMEQAGPNRVSVFAN